MPRRQRGEDLYYHGFAKPLRLAASFFHGNCARIRIDGNHIPGLDGVELLRLAQGEIVDIVDGRTANKEAVGLLMATGGKAEAAPAAEAAS